MMVRFFIHFQMLLIELELESVTLYIRYVYYERPYSQISIKSIRKNNQKLDRCYIDPNYYKMEFYNIKSCLIHSNSINLNYSKFHFLSHAFFASGS